MPSDFPKKRRNRRTIIIGGSMSGLFTAAFLQQIGWEADVYEPLLLDLALKRAQLLK